MKLSVAISTLTVFLFVFFAGMTSLASVQVPFSDGFELGHLNGEWTATGYTRVETGSNPAPHGGSYHLAFGIHGWGLDEATFQVDLNGRTNTVLRFWYVKSSPNGPRYATVLPETFSGSTNGNGVAISEDGTNWVKIMGMSDSEENPSGYTQYEIELDPIMAAHGISNSGIIYIRFIGYGTNPPGGAHFVDDLTIMNHPVQFDAGAVSTPEGQDVTLTVIRNGGTATVESVDFATVASNATEDVDYSGTTGTVMFAVGQSSRTITIPVRDDAVEEPDETFQVRLSNPSPGLDLGSPTVATVTIQDNDSSEVFPFRIGFETGVLGLCWTTHTEDNGVVVVDENDGSSGYPDTPSGSRSVWLDSSSGTFLSELNLHIDLSAQQNVTLEFLARGIGGDNFTLPSSFTGHANGKGVAVSSDGTTWYRILDLGQAPYEFTRYTFDLDAIFAAHGLSYGPDVQVRFVGYGNHYFDALGFDDVRIFSPNFEFEQAAVSSLETDSATLTVLRKGSTSGSASVNYATADGSATAGTDYSSLSGTLSFSDGEASNTITIPILNSPDVEPDKTFTVALSNPSSGYSLGAISQATVTIVDDDASTTLPVDETFGGVLADYWTTFGRAEIVDSELQLLDGGLREAILTVNPASQTNLFLRLRYRDVSWGNYMMPATFSSHGDSDGIAVSGDGTNWVKVLGLTHAEGTPSDLSYTNATVSLDPFLQAHGISVARPLKIKFQNYSTSSGSEFDFDDIVVYSRQPLDIATAALPHGTGMVAYAVSLSVSNGAPPYAWSTTNTLPAGMTLSTGGLLSGTPTEEGSFPFNVSVSDAWGATGAASRVLAIDPNTNRPPFVTARDPNTNAWVMGEGTNALFTLKAVDPEGASLTYTWTLDGSNTATVSTSFVYQTDWSDAGHHVLDVRVSDGLWSNVLASWAVQVSADNDGDGMSNAWERTYGLDPWDAADAGLDPDGDHLTNLQEAQLGTSPTLSDSNGDSLSDGWQNRYGQDPLQVRTIPLISLTRLGDVGGISNAQAVAAFGDVAYVADGQNGMLVFDASTATNPVLAQHYSTKDFAWDVSVESNRLYWSDGTNGLLKINVTSDPYAVLDSFQYLYSPVRVFKSTVDGTTAYVSTLDAVDDFHVLDVADGVPAPFRGDLDTTNSARDVTIQGSLAYVAGGDGEFTIIDVSNPDAPVVRGTLDTAVGTQGFEIAVTGTVAYLGVNSGDIYVADVSNPDAPVWTHTNTFTSASVQEIIAQDGFVFMAQDGEGIYSDGGLYVFDATNSDWSVSITNILTMDHMEDFCVTSNRLFVLDDEQGLVVFDYTSDYDQDGLPDSWERARFGSLDQGADDDPDGDGITNLGEQRAGTDPLKDDSDGDLIPDGWEVTHLLNPTLVADGTGNADGDPCNNSAEYVADTEPLDAADWFHITSIGTHLPVSLFFYSSTNRVYTMLGNSNLVGGTWGAVPGGGPRRGVGGADVMVDTNEPPCGPYYRMDVDLP